MPSWVGCWTRSGRRRADCERWLAGTFRQAWRDRDTWPPSSAVTGRGPPATEPRRSLVASGRRIAALIWSLAAGRMQG